jgi:hypothetical protein
MSETDDLMALDLEYRLTIAHRIGCECAPYFAGRREVLIPAVLEQAAKGATDPVDTFAAYARGVHARHLSGLSLAVSS